VAARERSLTTIGAQLLGRAAVAGGPGAHPLVGRALHRSRGSRYHGLHSHAGVGMGIRVAVAGASGYAGGELLRLIAGHPHLDLVAATAHGNAGAHVTAVHPHLAGLDLVLTATDPATLATADLVFLALPH